MPRVSISLVTWNGMSWLPACLESVRAQTMADWELLVVDNASSDGSTAWLLAQAADDPRIRVQALATNTGYGAAHNRSIRAARADVLVLLNQDVVLDPGFLHAACDELDADLSLGAVQGWIGRLGPSGERLDVTDSTGLVIHRDRRVVSRDQLLRRPPEERLPGYVWGADGPAPVYRRRALLEVRVPRRGGGWEVLDEDFFAEKEDADLAWRLQRMGWRCRHQPALMAWHARSGGDSGADGLAAGARANMTNPAAVRIRAWRNQRLMQLKNDELGAVLRDAPWIARREVAQLLFMLGADRQRLRALPLFMRLAPLALRKRRSLSRAQSRRRATGSRRRATGSGP